MKNNETGEESSDEFDTVMMAIGREPCTRGIGFDNVNVELAKNGKVIVNDKEETNVENIYAIGDILLNRLELTPVAIQVKCITSSRWSSSLYCHMRNSDQMTHFLNI